MRHAAAQAGPSLTMLTRCRLSIRRSRAPREPADPLQGVCAVPIAGPERDRPGVFRHRDFGYFDYRWGGFCSNRFGRFGSWQRYRFDGNFLGFCAGPLSVVVAPLSVFGLRGRWIGDSTKRGKGLACSAKAVRETAHATSVRGQAFNAGPSVAQNIETLQI